MWRRRLRFVEAAYEGQQSCRVTLSPPVCRTKHGIGIWHMVASHEPVPHRALALRLLACHPDAKGGGAACGQLCHLGQHPIVEVVVEPGWGGGEEARSGVAMAQTTCGGQSCGSTHARCWQAPPPPLLEQLL